jgi:hypothetical protein
VATWWRIGALKRIAHTVEATTVDAKPSIRILMAADARTERLA